MSGPDLEIHDWEVWYSYSTHLRGGIGDLPELAQSLVSSTLAECAVLHDGRCHWAGPSGPGAGELVLRQQSRRVPSATVELPAGAEGRAAHLLKLAAEFMVNERFLFGVDASPFPNHVRAFFGPVRLRSRRGHMTRWPVVKVYANGVVLVHLRRTRAKRHATLESFIRNQVNAAMHDFDELDAPPGYATLSMRAHAGQLPLPLQARRTNRARQHASAAAVAATTRAVEHGGSTYDLASMVVGAGEGRLDRLAIDLANTVAYVAAGSPTAGLFTGRRPAWNGLVGAHWRGRPHVHLLEFAGQSASAQENEERHRAAFAAILARGLSADIPMPRNSRLGQSQGVYIGAAGTLWVHTTDSLAEGRRSDRGALVFRDQTIVEALEYGYIVHRYLEERVLSTGTVDAVLALRQEVLDLKMRLAESSHYGEIQSILSDAWKAWGLDEIRTYVEQRLAVRETAQALRETRRTNRWAALLTVVFGVGAIPPLAEDVLGPVWTVAGWPRPVNGDQFKVVLLLVVSVLMGALLYIARRFFIHRSDE